MLSFIDFLEIFKWIFMLFSLQISAYIIIKLYLPKYALPLSFTAGLLLFALITWYIGFFGIYPAFSYIFVILILFYGLLNFQRIFSCFWNGWRYYAIFLFIFFIVLLVRIYFNADIGIRGQGEAFMAHAFVTQIMQNPVVPPHDPWFSGYRLDFIYYLGYWLYGMLGLTTGIPSNILFNLLSPTIAAITVINVYAIGESFLPKLPLFPVVIVLVLSPGFFYLLFQGNVPVYSILSTSTIFTHYPLYQFLELSARPHVFSVCLQTYLILLLSITIYYWQKLSKSNKLALIILTSLVLGSLFPINSWLAIIWWPITIICGLLLIYEENKHLRSLKNKNLAISHNWESLKNIFQTLSNRESAFFWLTCVILISSILYLPYILQFKSYALQGVAVIREPFDIFSFFLVFGWFIIGLIISLRKEIRLYLPIILIIVPFFLIKHLVAGFLLYLLIIIMIRRKDFFDFFAGFGLIVMIFCSFITFKEMYNFNDVLLKLPSATWILLGTSVSIMIGREICLYIENHDRKIQKIIEYCCVFMLIGLFILPGVFFVGPLLSYNPTLDGSTWLNSNHPSDAKAISYLKSLGPDHIIVETNGSRWTYESRVSTFSGIPTILGWEVHEYQWRTDHPSGWLNERAKDIKSIYEDPALTIPLMKKYNADLLYVGQIEKAHYSINLPESGLCKKYQNEEVTIFEIC
jgi:uncharacterized membrane protein